MNKFLIFVYALQLAAIISILVGVIIFISMFYFVLMSLHEEKYMAAKRALLLAFCLPIPYFAVALINFEFSEIVCYALVGFTAIIPVFFLLPIGNKFKHYDETPKMRIDERDIMFSRGVLQVGSDRFNEYYERNPEFKLLDDKFRCYPGLIQPGAVFYEPVTAAAAHSSFHTINALHNQINNEKLNSKQEKVNPARMTEFIKKWLKRLGAVSVGVTLLQDYHKYSIIGRGDQYGQPVELNHKNAIAFTVEMDKYLVNRAPKGPTVMESAQQYLNSGTIAVQLAEFIRYLGFSARAHIDSNYRVVCPLVARDAGLGEIGRMGLLMTPELGPRVRIAVVTTDLPLVLDDRNKDNSVMDFCRLCKKCAEVCPSQAISFDDREMIDGVLRWQINSEACFTLWSKIGTDCARCMAACPYSHPNNTMHNLVRFGVKRSGMFRKLALKLDDFFYGRNPTSLEVPDWMKDIIDKK